MTEATIEEWIISHLNTSPLETRLLMSLAVIMLLWGFRIIALQLIFARIQEPKVRYYWRNAIKYITVISGLVLISTIWIKQIDSLATFFGLLSAGLAIALKDPITNFAGWLFILIRRPFDVGHRVQIGDHSGDVIDIRFFQFTINEIGKWVDADQSTGRIIHIPNGKVFTESQINYNQGFSHIWNEIGVLVTFESNWERAKKLLEEIVGRHCAHFTKEAEGKLLEASKKFMIYYRTLDPIVYTAVKDSGVLLSMRYLCVPNKRRVTEDAIWKDVLKKFSQCNDIDFAYPTQRIYYNYKEGKPDARADKNDR
ncbi:mechanosensitive ion channel [Fulvivirga sp. RKSG066]|uniref:mechanosensitive ion channel family protein n=1 Tax=Fulvivirga aurantia TaxID=2529383 RepID=UPI0012BC8771|nr:mechanosensitive ion channel domain-containing protein [Fulvivirga aurantia]MTI22847.1 mechanosensitive ion channel [Fulvivirga aurantia]